MNDQSAHVTVRQTSTEELTIPHEHYHPAAKKIYKTPEAVRRFGLAYYYRHRDRILARAKAKRRSDKQKLQNQHTES